MATDRVRLTTAQALVRWMTAQRTEMLDGSIRPLFAGVFAIFGHGNVLGLGTALREVADVLPTWRAQNEQGMAMAAVAYARATDRRQVMVATSSIGPGALNMVTAAGIAHANRLPVLLLPGDTFAARAADPVLQQVEHFGDPTITVNDAFRPVSRYFDRIMRPEQLLATLPQVARVLLDPADTGPVTIALPQDVQAEEIDFPASFFQERLHRVPRPRADRQELVAAAAVVRRSVRPLLVLGGGVRYAGAGDQALELAQEHGIPVVDTVAGRTLVPHEHPLYGGPLGIAGSTSANRLALDADVVIAVGTRLLDFTTSSWTGFAPDASIVAFNVARFDAVKHGSQAVVGDAAETLGALGSALGAWRAPIEWSNAAEEERFAWDGHIDRLRAGADADGMLTYAQVVGAVNDASGEDDYVVAAAGGLPGELNGGWRTGPVSTRGGPTSGATMDLEYGFSCMGYETAAPWGAAMARQSTHPKGLVTALVGDGSYLMLNSELYSAARSGFGFVVVVCDNGGFAVIGRLQVGSGAAPFNNMLSDVRGPDEAMCRRVDFAQHAESLGCHVEDVPAGATVDSFRDVYVRARTAARTERRPAVVTCRTHPSAWTESGAWWETGVPSYLEAHRKDGTAKARQLRWVGVSRGE